jgi:hypothetical protein
MGKDKSAFNQCGYVVRLCWKRICSGVMDELIGLYYGNNKIKENGDKSEYAITTPNGCFGCLRGMCSQGTKYYHMGMQQLLCTVDPNKANAIMEYSFIVWKDDKIEGGSNWIIENWQVGIIETKNPYLESDEDNDQDSTKNKKQKTNRKGPKTIKKISKNLKESKVVVPNQVEPHHKLLKPNIFSIIISRLKKRMIMMNNIRY